MCFIGQERTYSEDEETVLDTRRSEYVASRCSRSTRCNSMSTEQHSNSTEQHSNSPRDVLCTKSEESDVTTKNWSAGFQPRSSTELVRNCQKVARETKELIVQAVFERVLQAPDAETVHCEGGKSWNRGGMLGYFS